MVFTIIVDIQENRRSDVVVNLTRGNPEIYTPSPAPKRPPILPPLYPSKNLGFKTPAQLTLGIAIGIEVGGPSVGIIETDLTVRVISFNTDLYFTLPSNMSVSGDIAIPA